MKPESEGGRRVMRRHIIVGASILALVAVALCGCGDDDGSDDVEGWQLQGDWMVSDIRFDDVVLREYSIFIAQTADSVTLIREQETISTGNIDEDILSCTDWDGYGLGPIYIERSDYMHSGTPDVEILKQVDFNKVWSE
jgi:hypothetical protein